jgi:ribonuclease HII
MARKKFDQSLIPPSPDLNFELALWQQGFKLVAGIDEAGRGALAGPVAVGAVILPANLPDLAIQLPGIRDSKQLKPKDRELAAIVIKGIAVSWAVGLAEAAEIDQLGIARATRLAAMRAVNQLACVPQHLLIDYIKLNESDLPQTSLVKGDQRSLSIACASILAKTTRDELMIRLGEQYPNYGFARHKGYGTAGHLAAIQACGACPIHRVSFAPFSPKLS